MRTCDMCGLYYLITLILLTQSRPNAISFVFLFLEMYIFIETGQIGMGHNNGHYSSV